MIYAFWNGKEIAKSDNTVIVEENHYFPKEDVSLGYMEKTDLHTRCPWKGLASYYSIVVDGKQNENAAWYYPEPLEKALMIKDHIAFWKGVEVREQE